MTHVGWAYAWDNALSDARVVELDGVDHVVDIGPTWRQFIDEAVSFIPGDPIAGQTTTGFGTFMFTDIVDSSARSLDLGDSSWAAGLEQHDRIIGDAVSQRNGKLVKHTGDGTLAVFTTPSDAVKTALDVSTTLDELGIPIRVGLNAGEFERRGRDVSGSVVNLAARVMDVAESGQVLATGTIAELLLGSRLKFSPTGEHTFKGFDRQRTVFEALRS